MFKRIAEWITGHKRSESKHPLDYVDRKAEELHAPYKVEKPAEPVQPVVEQKQEPILETPMSSKEEKPAKKAAKKPAKKAAVEAAPEVKKPVPAKKVAVKKPKKTAA